MTNILCWRDDCKHLTDGSVCGCDCISIDEDGECENFADYHEEAEWREVFWKRMLDRERNQECRVKALGKKHEICGRTFFTENIGVFASVTDAETGLIVGDLDRLDENLVENVKQKAGEWSPITDLPVATYDNKTRKFSYPEESEDTE